jgi:NADH pyrophosphatase NudC (nudix superfamily)
VQIGRRALTGVHLQCTLAVMPNRTEPVTIWICGQCGHEWQSKDNRRPLRCAKCKSPYWDRVKPPAAMAKRPKSNTAKR